MYALQKGISIYLNMLSIYRWIITVSPIRTSGDHLLWVMTFHCCGLIGPVTKWTPDLYTRMSLLKRKLDGRRIRLISILHECRSISKPLQVEMSFL
ncbi:hypothetical protein TNCV_2978821 [Trichonephila clavipes]|nr:hypothetical protein TNCV_2978821 [Trichonephila clavipes]